MNKLIAVHMGKFAIILMCLFFSIKGFATHQVEDYVIFNNDTLYFNDLPNHVHSPLELINDTLGRIINPDIISSGCWRGYYAEWRIIDNILYLSKVFDCFTHKEIEGKVIEEAIGRKFTNKLLKADWVNGSFSCGKNLIFALYLSVYKDNYRLLIENGKIINIEYYQKEEEDIFEE